MAMVMEGKKGRRRREEKRREAESNTQDGSQVIQGK